MMEGDARDSAEQEETKNEKLGILMRYF